MSRDPHIDRRAALARRRLLGQNLIRQGIHPIDLSLLNGQVNGLARRMEARRIDRNPDKGQR